MQKCWREVRIKDRPLTRRAERQRRHRRDLCPPFDPQQQPLLYQHIICYVVV